MSWLTRQAVEDFRRGCCGAVLQACRNYTRAFGKGLDLEAITNDAIADSLETIKNGEFQVVELHLKQSLERHRKRAQRERAAQQAFVEDPEEYLANAAEPGGQNVIEQDDLLNIYRVVFESLSEKDRYLVLRAWPDLQFWGFESTGQPEAWPSKSAEDRALSRAQEKFREGVRVEVKKRCQQASELDRRAFLAIHAAIEGCQLRTPCPPANGKKLPKQGDR